ncbi:hypothetical protein PSEUBRA_001859 [Kalmanozyma brasiliensis GHG001]|uniref:uncharacterized protein n=1 Tax=Kalmanozyma brasiliensis (strain GHG001) TaxID=1365824 RepID=UPI002867B53B|nr:uncharacterized protein PSEUBRA_001859 [Kalmanozyma brasiliensis GHG001]KAF6767006.1 hypothetical protein PSEUBRA_001859 [Kalmanozyma brasiliensis GHG001]
MSNTATSPFRRRPDPPSPRTPAGLAGASAQDAVTSGSASHQTVVPPSSEPNRWEFRWTDADVQRLVEVLHQDKPLQGNLVHGDRPFVHGTQGATYTDLYRKVFPNENAPNGQQRVRNKLSSIQDRYRNEIKYLSASASMLFRDMTPDHQDWRQRRRIAKLHPWFERYHELILSRSSSVPADSQGVPSASAHTSTPLVGTRVNVNDSARNNTDRQDHRMSRRDNASSDERRDRVTALHHRLRDRHGWRGHREEPYTASYFDQASNSRDSDAVASARDRADRTRSYLNDVRRSLSPRRSDIPVPRIGSSTQQPTRTSQQHAASVSASAATQTKTPTAGHATANASSQTDEDPEERRLRLQLMIEEESTKREQLRIQFEREKLERERQERQEEIRRVAEREERARKEREEEIVRQAQREELGRRDREAEREMWRSSLEANRLKDLQAITMGCQTISQMVLGTTSGIDVGALLADLSRRKETNGGSSGSGVDEPSAT